ncbi:electron transport complex subunit RsxG [Thalassotalea eurytherma]|uniref:Ion-translocating oxidoreductase complex subunit G n=1 Tax=Thalassotalea eurytherma TaxID=1144278 RepID=A0ABQ6H9J0_9GAMM|nr:electron transport complex subunit RsxG [Thalassotalea eurytherma]GLX83566.1 electron transport complex subunit G [Thalassotalea eurytherma]
MKKAINKNAQLLAAFAIACTLAVGVISELTSDRIAQQEQAQLLKTLHTIIDKAAINNDLYQDCTIANDPLLGSTEDQTVYLGKLDDAPVAAAITAIAPDGYNGKISLLIAFDIDGIVTGVRTLKHNETPGLGDKIELKRSDWITSFNGKTITKLSDSRWNVKKDGGMFDQFTGATITPRAVVKAVKNANLYFNQHKQSLFESTVSCRGES